eukprot:3180330-Rhodomonas_salina.3
MLAAEALNAPPSVTSANSWPSVPVLSATTTPRRTGSAGRPPFDEVRAGTPPANNRSFTRPPINALRSEAPRLSSARRRALRTLVAPLIDARQRNGGWRRQPEPLGARHHPICNRLAALLFELEPPVLLVATAHHPAAVPACPRRHGLACRGPALAPRLRRHPAATVLPVRRTRISPRPGVHDPGQAQLLPRPLLLRHLLSALLVPLVLAAHHCPPRNGLQFFCWELIARP